MIRPQRLSQRLVILKGARGIAGFTSALMLSACSQTTDLLPSGNFLLADNAPTTTAASPGSGGENELQKATIYWGQEYSKKPADLPTALNYARNLKALGEKQKALTVLQQASAIHHNNPDLAGEYGRLALELDQISVANRLLSVADNPTKPDWRVISARGTVEAKQGKYKEAIGYYERALTLSNNQPSVLNNLAMAHAMNGEPQKAEELLRQASAGPNVDPKMKQNLALVLSLQGRYDEAKSFAVTPSGAAAVKSDTDLIRQIVRLEPKSMPAATVPAFTTNIAYDTSVPVPPATATGPVLRSAVSDAAAVSAWDTHVAQVPEAQTARSTFKGTSH